MQQVIESDPTGVDLCRAGPRGDDDRHAECFCNLCNAVAECTVPDDPERHRGELAYRVCHQAKVLGFLPFAGRHRLPVSPQIVRQVQETTENMFRNGLRAVVANIADGDTVLLRCLQVDIIRSGGREPDELQTRVVGKQSAH